MYTIPQIAHAITFAKPVVEHWLEYKIPQWDWSDDPLHHEHCGIPKGYFECQWLFQYLLFMDIEHTSFLNCVIPKFCEAPFSIFISEKEIINSHL